MEMAPSLCTVCLSPAHNVVPERSEEWLFHGFCTVCLDEMLGFFPITVKALRARETTGRYLRCR